MGKPQVAPVDGAEANHVTLWVKPRWNGGCSLRVPQAILLGAERPDPTAPLTGIAGRGIPGPTSVANDPDEARSAGRGVLLTMGAKAAFIATGFGTQLLLPRLIGDEEW